MASFTGSSIKDVYKDLLHTSNSNTGIGSTIKQITCGDGDTSALYLSDRNLKVQPSADSTTNTVIYDAGGNALLTVDSTNDLVKAGIGQHNVTTQYAHFGIGSGDAAAVTNSDGSVWSGSSGNTHYAVPFNGYVAQSLVSIGTGTNPDTSLSISTTADDVICTLWYVMDNITIDRVIWWSGGDAASGDTTRCHLQSFTIDSGNGSTGGDLSSGTLLAHNGSSLTVGADRITTTTLTVDSSSVAADKVILAFVENVGAATDLTAQLIVKYHYQ